MLSDQELIKKADRVLAFHVPISHLMQASGRMVPCPFHSDTLPSAKFYADTNGERLYCFSCRKQFTSADYVRQIGSLDPVQYLKQYYTDADLELMIKQLPEDNRKREPAIKVDELVNQFLIKRYDIAGFIRSLYSFKKPVHVRHDELSPDQRELVDNWSGTDSSTPTLESANFDFVHDEEDGFDPFASDPFSKDPLG